MEGIMKYKVSIPFVCYVEVKVESETREQAIEEAMEEARITSFCGNGGSDKLIGVYGSNVSIYANEEPLDWCKDFDIEVYDEEGNEVED
jgi:hypothetical protein